jgi:hypothetical protein
VPAIESTNDIDVNQNVIDVIFRDKTLESVIMPPEFFQASNTSDHGTTENP